MKNINIKNSISLSGIIQYYYWRFYGKKSFPVYKPRKPAIKDFLNIFSVEARLLKKTFIIFLLFSLNWYGVNAITRTTSYFSDAETSSDNLISAGILDIVVNGDSIKHEEITYHDSISTIFSVEEVGDVTSLYGLKVEADGTLCEFLNLNVTFFGEENVEYTDVGLLGFETGKQFSSGDWNFTINLPKANRKKKGDCSFDFVFEAKQKTDGNIGAYWDEERLENWIGTGKKECDKSLDEIPVVSDESLKMMGSMDVEMNLVIEEEQVEEEKPVEEEIIEEKQLIEEEEQVEEKQLIDEEIIEEEEKIVEEEIVEEKQPIEEEKQVEEDEPVEEQQEQLELDINL